MELVVAPPVLPPALVLAGGDGVGVGAGVGGVGVGVGGTHTAVGTAGVESGGSMLSNRDWYADGSRIGVISWMTA